MYRFCFIFLIFLNGCTRSSHQTLPQILSESEMLEVLVDVHLMESASKLNLLDGPREDSMLLRMHYNLYFDSKPYSLEDFKTSFEYYSEDPKTMEILFDSVLNRIQMLD